MKTGWSCVTVCWDWPKLTLNVLLQSKGKSRAENKIHLPFRRAFDATRLTFVNKDHGVHQFRFVSQRLAVAHTHASWERTEKGRSRASPWESCLLRRRPHIRPQISASESALNFCARFFFSFSPLLVTKYRFWVADLLSVSPKKGAKEHRYWRISPRAGPRTCMSECGSCFGCYLFCSWTLPSWLARNQFCQRGRGRSPDWWTCFVRTDPG